MLMITPLGIPRLRENKRLAGFGISRLEPNTRLAGLGDFVDDAASWFGWNSPTPEDEVITLTPEEVAAAEPAGASSTGESSGWFSWLGNVFGGGGGVQPPGCDSGGIQPGSMCWNAGWRPNGQGSNVKIGGNAPTTSPNSPIGWQDTVGNAINAIVTGFWPKPTSNTQPVVTAPVVVAPTPWYKTTPGMIGIAAGVIGGAYLLTRKK